MLNTQDIIFLVIRDEIMHFFYEPQILHLWIKSCIVHVGYYNQNVNMHVVPLHANWGGHPYILKTLEVKECFLICYEIMAYS